VLGAGWQGGVPPRPQRSTGSATERGVVIDLFGRCLTSSLTAERKALRYSRGRPVLDLRLSGRRNEALDCLVMAFAARQAVTLNPDTRERELRTSESSTPRVSAPAQLAMLNRL
jgi:phage terminase large subunit GpA-like protein